MKYILKNKYLKDIASSFFLVTLSIIFLSNLFFQNQLFSTQDYGLGDLTHYNYPVKDFLANQLKQGQLPLWTDQIYTGFPLFAESQTGTFFLPNLLLYYALPTNIAFNLSYLFIFICASIGTYFYSRFLSFTRLASLFSAIIYTYSFVFVSHIGHLNLLQEIALFPWLLLTGTKLFTSSSRKYVLLFSFLLSQQFFAGHIQETVYSAITIFFILLFQHRKSNELMKNTVLYGFSCLLAVGLSSIQIFPTAELIFSSTRNGFAASGFSYPFTFKDLAYLVNPYFWGDPSLGTNFRPAMESAFWENNMYSGIIPLLLLGIGFIQFKKAKKVRVFYYTFIIVLLFCLGILFFLSYIPPFSMFRMNQRSLFLLVFSYAIIAGYIFNSLPQYIEKYVTNGVLRNIFLIVIVMATIIDLFVYGKGYNGGISSDKWLQTPPTVQYLKSQNIQGRVFTVGNFEDWQYIYKNISHGWRGEAGEKLLTNRAMLYPNANMYYGINHYYGYTGVRSQNVNDMLALSFYGSNFNGSKPIISSSSAKLLGMGNVQYIVATQNLVYPNKELTLVWKKFNPQTQTTYTIYKNNYYVPRLHAVENIISETSLQGIAKKLLSPSFDPQTTAILNGFIGDETLDKNVLITQIKLNEQNISFNTSSKGQSFVVLEDTIYPGWKATIDNEETNLVQANISNKGVFIPAGNHTIAIYYDPDSLKIGIFFSCVTVVLMLLIFFGPIISKSLNKK